MFPLLLSKTRLAAYFLAIIAAVFFAACSSDDSSFTDRDSTADASYKVTFNSTWNSETFPTNFPSGAHFSGLIGATHNEQVKFWEPGQIASDGIVSMAETGSRSILTAEIEAQKSEGKAEFLLSGAGNDASGLVEFEFDINQEYSLITLVSMVAPSPDWFVGVRDLSLFDEAENDWKQTMTVSLIVYDAGSDNGLVFEAANADTQPREVITRLSSAPEDTDFVEGVTEGGEFIGSFTFERIK